MFDRTLDLTAWFVVAFIAAPLVVIIGGSFTTSPFVDFPPVGLTRDWYRQLMGRADCLRSCVDRLKIAGIATAVATVIGVATALGLARLAFRGMALFRAFVMSPLILPTIVTGVALMQFLHTAGAISTLTGLVIGHTLITIPYVVRTVGAGLVGMNREIEEAAESLGAGALRVLLRVTLPAIAPAIMASTIFVFITSFDQVTVSIFLSGPDVTPLPIRIYTYIDYAIDPMVAAVSTLLILFAFVVVAVLQRLLGLERAFGASTR